MKQLFDEDTDRKEALLDSKAMVDAMNDLGIRIKGTSISKTVSILGQTLSK